MNAINNFFQKKLSDQILFYFLLIGAFFTYFLTLDHISLGNGSVFPLHALSLIETGKFNFVIPDEPGDEISLNFHTPLYTIWISLFFWAFNQFTDLDPFSINLAIKAANSLIILATAYVFSLFFLKTTLSRKLIFVIYLILPTTFFGYISADMDQVMMPLFFLSAYYCLETRRSAFLPVLFFSLAILTKENTGIVFMVIIMFGQALIFKNISLFSSLKIILLSLILSFFSYIGLCRLFDLDPSFLFTTSEQISAGSLSGSALAAHFNSSFVQSRLLIQQFGPFLLLFIPALFKKELFFKPEFIFLFLLFFSVFGISVITGYTNIRYFSSIAPIMVLLLFRLTSDLNYLRLKDFFVMIFLSLAYIYIVSDQYLFLSALSALDFSAILIRALILLIFSFIIIFFVVKNNQNPLFLYLISASILSLNLSWKDYQLLYDHGNSDIKKIINIIGNKHVFSDLPAAGLYFRDNMTYITPSISHWHSPYSMAHPLEKDVVSDKREVFLKNKSASINSFYIWTRKGTDFHTKFFLNSNCQQTKFTGYNFLYCVNSQ